MPMIHNSWKRMLWSTIYSHSHLVLMEGIHDRDTCLSYCCKTPSVAGTGPPAVGIFTGISEDKKVYWSDQQYVLHLLLLMWQFSGLPFSVSEKNGASSHFVRMHRIGKHHRCRQINWKNMRSHTTLDYHTKCRNVNKKHATITCACITLLLLILSKTIARCITAFLRSKSVFTSLAEITCLTNSTS